MNNENNIKRKTELFNKIYEITIKQREVLQFKNIDTDKLKDLINKKQEYIEKINKIDKKYNLKGILSEESETLIHKIQELEKENIDRLDKYFSTFKKEMINFNKSKNVTNNYNTYNQNHYSVGSIFFDRSR